MVLFLDLCFIDLYTILKECYLTTWFVFYEIFLHLCSCGILLSSFFFLDYCRIMKILRSRVVYSTLSPPASIIVGPLHFSINLIFSLSASSGNCPG